MIGWKPVPPIGGGHDDVEACQGVLCGALVRVSDANGRARQDHDLAFHQHDKEASILSADFTDALMLLAAGYDDSPCRLDHNGDCQAHGYFDFNRALGCPMTRTGLLLVRHGMTQEMADEQL